MSIAVTLRADSMRSKRRFFAVLFLAGFVGVVSLLLIDLEELVTALQIRDNSDVPPITPFIRFLSLVQPTILLALAVYIGVALASKVGLSAPVAEAAAGGAPIGPALTPQILPGVIGGVLGGSAIVLTSLLWSPWLPAEAVTRISAFQHLVPFPTRLLYGGITEEILLRWGFMTLLVWLAWRYFLKGRLKLNNGVYISTILISAVVFAIGHVPIAYVLFATLSASLIGFAIVLNSIFGLVAGYLFWKKGLESAIIAHMLAHVLMLMASYFGAYF